MYSIILVLLVLLSLLLQYSNSLKYKNMIVINRLCKNSIRYKSSSLVSSSLVSKVSSSLLLSKISSSSSPPSTPSSIPSSSSSPSTPSSIPSSSSSSSSSSIPPPSSSIPSLSSIPTSSPPSPSPSSPSSSSSLPLNNNTTIKTIYNNIIKIFNNNNISEPEASARYLISYVSNIGYTLTDFNNINNNIITINNIIILNNLINKRIMNEPIQYIIGNWDFYGIQYDCKQPILIPRPETEELVEYIINSNIIQSINDDNHKIRLLDIGSGTGVIGITLLYQLKSKDIECIAIDINNDAVNLSLNNAKKILMNQCNRYHCLNYSFIDYVNICLNDQSFQPFDIIVSNPPYIPTDEMNTLQPEVKDYEDHRALHGGNDGLNIIRDIIIHAPLLLRKDGPKEIWMEVSSSHLDMIEDWMKQPGVHSDNCILLDKINDLSGRPRFVRLKSIQ